MVLPVAPHVLVMERGGSRRAHIEVLDAAGFRVTTAARHEEVVALVRSSSPEAVILDVGADRAGIAVACELRIETPDVAVVMIGEDDDVVAALRAGARGYLSTDVEASQVPTTLRWVLRGEFAVARHLTGALVEALGASHRPRELPTEHGPVRLTERESQVLDLLSAGLSTREVAQELFVSQVTVRSHIWAIVHKVGATSRDQVVALVQRYADEDHPTNGLPGRGVN